ESQRMIRGVRERAGVADNRAVYQVVSGMADHTYMIFSPYRTFRDAGDALDPSVVDNDLDDAARSRLRDLMTVAVQNSETFIFFVSPQMSNPAGEWIVDDPEFWRASPAMQKGTPAAPKKPEGAK